MTTHARDVADYVDGVTSGRIVTGRLARLAVWRYLDDRQHAGERGFYFDESKACDFLDFCSVCCHTQGEWAGKPFELQPWQKFIDWNVFGWRRKDDGTRRFRKDYEEIARKGGKTTRCGPKAFYLSVLDDPIERGGQGYCAATKEDQARLLFDEMVRMVESSPALTNYCETYKKRIVFPSTQSYMQVLGSDSKSQDGFNPHFVIRDELHAWQEKHRGLKEKLETGFGARRQPLTVTITTAGDDKSCIWIEEHDYAVRVLESVITGNIVDDTFFAFIAAIDYEETPCFRCKGDDCPWCAGTGTIPKDDPFDEAIWIKANPNVGITPKWDRLRDAANEAKHKPAAMNQFLRYHCNVRVASTERAILPETWRQCAGELSDWTYADKVHGGFDLGRSNDFAGACMMAAFTETDDNGEEFTRYEARIAAWTCRDRHEDIQTEQVRQWVRDGLLFECGGNQINYTDIEDWLVSQTAINAVRTWAYDPAFAHQMGQRLQELHGIEVFPFPQNAFRYNEPTRKLVEKLLHETRTVNGEEVRLFRHDGNSLFGWCANNLMIRRDARDQWMPDKIGSPFKIDPMVACIMGLSECVFSDAGGFWKPGSIRL